MKGLGRHNRTYIIKINHRVKNEYGTERGILLKKSTFFKWMFRIDQIVIITVWVVLFVFKRNENWAGVYGMSIAMIVLQALSFILSILMLRQEKIEKKSGEE